MAKTPYKDVNFRPASLKMIRVVNAIITDYLAQGLRLTLRQVYYQCVVQNLFPNSEKSYKNLGSLISDARLAGLMDWDAIEDRVRRPRKPSEFASLGDLVNAALYAYRLPRWEGQENYVELWCFTPETLVTTPAGVAPISTVAVGDLVLDRDGVSRRVTHVFKRPYDGPVVEIKACGLLPFRVTPEHPIYAAKADASRPGYKGAKRPYAAPGFVAAGTLTKFDHLYVPRTTAVATVSRQQFTGGPRTPRAPKVVLDDDFYAVAGYYLAEGSVRGDERTLQFVFSRFELNYVKRVERWARDHGFSTSTALGAGTRVVYVYGKAAATFFGEQFGRGSHNKRLPGWVITLPCAVQMTLLKHYFQGDACLCNASRDGIALTTRSEVLARQVQGVLARCGYPAALGRVTDHGTPIYRVDVNGTHLVRLAAAWDLALPPRKYRFSNMRITDTHVTHPIQSVRTVPYAGDVYNLEVEVTNTYCVPCVVHNCEKDALAGVLGPIASKFHVTMMVNKGYSSSSAMHEAATRYRTECRDGQRPTLIYVGDMDPSGEDMVRDIDARLDMFGVARLDVRKIALTMDQVEEYNPPPNPAKLSDSRAKKYVAAHGRSSWEVDALPPRELTRIITDELEDLVDRALMDAVVAREEVDKRVLRAAVAGNKKLQ